MQFDVQNVKDFEITTSISLLNILIIRFESLTTILLHSVLFGSFQKVRNVVHSEKLRCIGFLLEGGGEHLFLTHVIHSKRGDPQHVFCFSVSLPLVCCLPHGTIIIICILFTSRRSTEYRAKMCGLF